MRVISTVIGLLAVTVASAQQPKPVAKVAPEVGVVSIPDDVTNSASAMARWLKAHTANAHVLQQSLYKWIATHITYDVPNMYQQRDYRDTVAAIQRTLRSRVGVSADYASLYAKVCQEAGIAAYTVNGYCLQHGGLAPTGSHDWVVVKNGGSWTVTDPTWGAGTVDGARYTPQLNWEWFQMSPQVAVKRHVPFDPMWQLLSNPVRHDEAGVSRLAGNNFNYNDTIALYLRSARYERLAGTLARMERYGGGANPFVMAEIDWLSKTVKVLAANRQIEERNRLVDKYESAEGKYQEMVRMYNDYVTYKNKQFQPEQPDAAIRKMMDNMTGRLGEVEKLMGEMRGRDVELAGHLGELEAAVRGIREKIVEEQGFVNKYIKTERGKRRELFYVGGV
ncbi:transglutaminase superfamily protein [Chitinophaga dinghuensis]|uniref:Transglutaminase superfamily protein n=1 Tax=Chitinophaga dinghuensis TaxID=1539050 RepID=A0A327WCG8_9BACT|nr:transglutaminase domain-containing protein [Chitinophaga dinghuensis]RAJ87572.1 transglutaminase superfamily protein [Chitinophaga dinghuensis]